MLINIGKAQDQYSRFKVHPIRMPRGESRLGMGYDDQNNYIYAIGGFNYRKSLVRYNLNASKLIPTATNQSCTDFGSEFFLKDVTPGTAWTQISNIVYIVTSSKIYTFDVFTTNIDYNYATLPTTTRGSDCVTSISLEDDIYL